MQKLTAIIAFTLLIVGTLGVSLRHREGSSLQGTEFLALNDVTTIPSIGATGGTFFSCLSPRNEQWSYTQEYRTFSCRCNGNTYLGRYGQGEVVTSPSFAVGPHQGIVVSFKLALIDSWDSETFKITADGVLVYNSTWSCKNNNSTCMHGYWGDIYNTVTFGFNHTANTVTFVITSNLDQTNDDESWGICNFNVVPSSNPVLANGSSISISDTTPRIYFPCSNPVKDNTWTYTGYGYNSVTCFGYTFLGRYTVGDSVSSPAIPIGSHQSITISFKLALIDSWDSEYFKVTADGVEVASFQWKYTSATTNTCGNSYRNFNDIYQNLTYSFNHSASTVTFVFSSTLDGYTVDDESWGICDFTVTPSPNRV